MNEITPLSREIIHTFWLSRCLFVWCRENFIGVTIVVMLSFLIFPGLIIAAGIIDDTLFLAKSNGGRGVLEHFGTWSQVISTPILLLMAIGLQRSIGSCLQEVKEISRKPETESLLEDLEDVLRCESPHFKTIYILMIIFGSYSLIINIQNTRQAVAIYGQDVWDSSNHIYGYVVGKLFLGFEWIVVFPFVIYVAASCWFSIVQLANEIVEKELIEFSPYTPDKCSGFKVLGSIMIRIGYLGVPFVFIIVAHIFTHSNFYITLLFASSLVIVCLVAILLLPFYKVHLYLSNQQKKYLSNLAKQITKCQMKTPNIRPYEPWLTVMASDSLYSKASEVSTWPYMKSDVFKLLTPLYPTVIATALRLLIA